MTVPADDGGFARAVEVVGSAILGGLTALVTFRTRLRDMERDNQDRKREIEAERTAREEAVRHLNRHIESRLGAIDRRSMAQLRMTADIARAVNVDHRFTDTVLQMLTDDAQAEDKP
jgi:hypothetical protein